MGRGALARVLALAVRASPRAHPTRRAARAPPARPVRCAAPRPACTGYALGARARGAARRGCVHARGLNACGARRVQ